MITRLALGFSALLKRVSQCRFEPLKLHELAANDHQLLSDQIPNVYARFPRVALDREQLANFFEGKSELLCLLNKLQVGNLALMIEAIAASGAIWPRQQPGLFIEADCINAQAGLLRDLSNL